MTVSYIESMLCHYIRIGNVVTTSLFKFGIKCDMNISKIIINSPSVDQYLGECKR